jgi:UTP-glucose-1-phosphate uridylyltransferase
MANPTLLILAAGVGSRYGGLKQVDPVGAHGEILMDYTIFDACRAGFDRVVFVIRDELAASFRERFDSIARGRFAVDYVNQELSDLPAGFEAPPRRAKPWGTGHAVWAARQVIDKPFAVVNADDFYGPQAYSEMARFFAENDAITQFGKLSLCMVAFRLRNTLSDYGTVARGICSLAPDGTLLRVTERTKIERDPDGVVRYHDNHTGSRDLDADALVSMNCWGFRPQVFPLLQDCLAEFLGQQADSEKAEFYLPTAVDTLNRRQLCSTRVLSTESEWFGMTYREEHDSVAARIRALTAAGHYPGQLWD